MIAQIDTRFGDLQPDFWQAAGETLVMATVALVLGGLLGLGLGLGLYLTRKGGLYANRAVAVVLNVVVNFFRPIPFIIFVAALQPLARHVVGTGIGIRAATFAITVAAIFGISRIVEQNLVTVSPGIIEAARAMGAKRDGRPDDVQAGGALDRAVSETARRHGLGDGLGDGLDGGEA